MAYPQQRKNPGLFKKAGLLKRREPPLDRLTAGPAGRVKLTVLRGMADSAHAVGVAVKRPGGGAPSYTASTRFARRSWLLARLNR